MGFFKKSDKADGDDDNNRRALFGSRSKNKSPAQNSNPYAQPIPTDPYTKAKVNAGVAPSPNQPGGNGPHAIPSDNKYAAYTPNAYGNQGGYGSDRFGGASSGAGSGTPSRYGAGGYGGLSVSDPNDPSAGDSARNELFGGAKDRAKSGSGGAPPPYSEGGQGGQQGQNQPAYGGGSNEYSMAKFEDRQLTAEEEEEESVQATKQEMRHVKQGDVSSTRNALRVAAQAEETGRNTLARLGAQGELIHGAEDSLDMATVEGRLAEEKARELKTLNKSMFAVHVANPFTSASRRRERDEKILNTHREERDARDGTRSEAYQSNARMERMFRDIDRDAQKAGKAKKASVTERAKYQFEADSEDEAMEDEIEQNLDLLQGAAGRLNGLAKATGRELDEQNRHLERITGKSDFVDDQIAMNRAKLDRIR
ncbi:hypothetical protein N7540_003748 [Penicillium herquei]|nr:hypothetical protein N7540_003748 [Penicillium herquei]